MSSLHRRLFAYGRFAAIPLVVTAAVVAGVSGASARSTAISPEIDACNLKGQQGYLDAEAKALGATVIPLNTTAGPPSWQANLSTALTDKANAVVMLCGPAASAVGPQLQALANAH